MPPEPLGCRGPCFPVVPDQKGGEGFAICVVEECCLAVGHEQIDDYLGLVHLGPRAFRLVLFTNIIVGF